MISSSQRPLPDNTQHSQQTDIHAPGGIRTHNLSRRAVVDLRLRRRGHWRDLDNLTVVQAAHSPQLTAHSPQLTAHSPQPTAHSPQLTAHSPQPTAHSSQLTAHHTLFRFPLGLGLSNGHFSRGFQNNVSYAFLNL